MTFNVPFPRGYCLKLTHHLDENGNDVVHNMIQAGATVQQ